MKPVGGFDDENSGFPVSGLQQRQRFELHDKGACLYMLHGLIQLPLRYPRLLFGDRDDRNGDRGKLSSKLIALIFAITGVHDLIFWNCISSATEIR